VCAKGEWGVEEVWSENEGVGIYGDEKYSKGLW
jgi:hypothetical protein